MSQQENVGESRTEHFGDAVQRASNPPDLSYMGNHVIMRQGGRHEKIGESNPWQGSRTVGFGDLDYEHGAKGPRYGSDENY